MEIPWKLIDKIRDNQKLWENEVKTLYRLKNFLERSIRLTGNHNSSKSVVTKTSRATRLTIDQEIDICRTLNIMNQAFDILKERYPEISQIWETAIIHHDSYIDTAIGYGFTGSKSNLVHKISHRIKKSAFIISSYRGLFLSQIRFRACKKSVNRGKIYDRMRNLYKDI